MISYCSDCNGKEVWRRIPGFKRWYQVSNRGTVRRLAHVLRDKNGQRRLYKEQLLKSRVRSDGYPQIWLRTVQNKPKCMAVHTLVLLSFAARRRVGEECRHKDRNPLHSCASNLSWGNHQANTDDRDRHGTTPKGEGHGCCKLSDAFVLKILSAVDEGESMPSVALQYGITRSHVHNLCTGATRVDVYAKWVKKFKRIPSYRSYPARGPAKKLTSSAVNRLLQAYKKCGSVSRVAAQFDVSDSLVRRLLKTTQGA